MRKSGTMAILASVLVLLIFTAGFFHGESRSPAASEVAALRPACPVPSPRAGAEVEEMVAAPAAGRAQGSKGLLALTNAPGYKRAGDLTLRVADCTKAEDDLESKLQAIKGEIVDMVMEGTEGSRTCTLSAIIPADQFRGFIADLRKMGKVQSERITASKLRPGQAEGTAVAGGPDPRELSLISLRMADEKVAQNVLESRGILAASFDRSASHFMKGLAVIVELVGLSLPFVLAFLSLALPVLLGLRLRRPRAALTA
jgi:hypothetical protein